MSFILLNVLSVVVDATGIVIEHIGSDRIVGKACWNGKVPKYRSTIFLDFDCFNIGLNILGFRYSTIQYHDVASHIKLLILVIQILLGFQDLKVQKKISFLVNNDEDVSCCCWLEVIEASDFIFFVTCQLKKYWMVARFGSLGLWFILQL